MQNYFHLPFDPGISLICEFNSQKMPDKKITVLIVDDEEINLDILEEYLVDQGFSVVKANDGQTALEILISEKYSFSAILLDRMMPGISGFEVLKIIRNDEKIKNIPVIFQTAAATNKDVVDGIKAGAYYYLTKPFDPELLLSVVASAIEDYHNLQNVIEAKNNIDDIFRHIQEIKLQLRTIDDARKVSAGLAILFPDTEKALIGLTEIMINAIEHGNLEISYEQKSELLKSNSWAEEIARRLDLEEYKYRWVFVELSRSSTEVAVMVTDEGAGFNWSEYLEINLDRLSASHGRGIALANMISFDSMTYIGSGNIVKCVTKI